MSAKAQNSLSAQSTLHLTLHAFSYMRSGELLNWSKPYSILYHSCKPNTLTHVLLAIEDYSENT